MILNSSQLYSPVFEFAARQLRSLVTSSPGFFPMYTTHGHWHHQGEAWTNWCEGFLGGQLWLLYQYSGDPWWRSQAIAYTQRIEPRKMDRSVHDLGFLFIPTWKKWYDLESDPQVDQVVITAGQTLAKRFNEKGKYLRSFVAEDSLFIDIMMNVGIIYYAAEKTGDESLWQIANQHCLTTRRFLVRGDGSTAHEGIFDLETGGFLHQSTQQGWRSDSCWARGQAWALYGFATAFAYTQDPLFLHTAQACANFYIQHTPTHGIPPNDWDEPEPQQPYESSAAAIAASGLLDLAKLTDVPQLASQYQQSALSILETLTSPEFLAVNKPAWEGILKHGIYHQQKHLGVDESVMWGDFFFLEALSKVVNDER